VPLLRRRPKRKTATVHSVAAPIGGWNVKDPLPEMEPLDAVILDNWFCLPSELQIRKGYTEWSTGLDGEVQTLFSYVARGGGQKLLAATNNGGACQIYDVSSIGAVGAPVVSGLTSAKLRHSHFTTPGGTFLHVVNGVDPLMIYDGTTVNIVTGVSAPYAITNVATTSLTDVIVHKTRLWFVEKNSMNLWYLPAFAIAGAAVKFDLGPLFRRGGHIVKVDTWTLDAGYGVDDYLMAFTSEGEVAVYGGTDPSSIATFSLHGVFYIGSPTDTVAHTVKYGGDLLVINKDGIAQMSKSLMSSRVSTKLTLTEKIQPQLAKDTSQYASNNGWDMILYPPQNMLLVNVPISTTESYQYVMNTISGAWSRWKNIPARCWYTANDLLYFGGTGTVYKAWDSQSDNGNTIRAEMLPAYNSFGGEGRLKRWSMARVIYSFSADYAIASKMMIDFDRNLISVSIPVSPPANMFTWGVSLWGDGSIWGGALYIDNKWRSVYGLGYWGSLQILVDNKQSDIRVYTIDYSVEGGGVF
jgi:hypothetical protein